MPSTGKRPRDDSSSHSGDEAASDRNTLSTEPEDLHSTKIIAYDSHIKPGDKHVMHCSLPPHTGSLTFDSLEEFEVHYVKEHTNRCAECGKNLPSDHFLSLHIDENHNPVREALAAKGEKTYACFVIDCDKKCSTPQKRRMHMIDKHGFPKVYNFRVVNEGVDNAKTLLQDGRRRRVSVTNDQSSSYRSRGPSVSKPNDRSPGAIKDSAQGQNKAVLFEPKVAYLKLDSPDASKDEPSPASSTVDDLERSFAALHFIPRSILSKQSTSQSQG